MDNEIVKNIGLALIGGVLALFGKSSFFSNLSKSSFKLKERQLDEQTEGYSKALEYMEKNIKSIIESHESNVKTIISNNREQTEKLENNYKESLVKVEKELSDERVRNKEMGTKVYELEIKIVELRGEIEAVKLVNIEAKKENDYYRHIAMSLTGVKDLVEIDQQNTIKINNI